MTHLLVAVSSHGYGHFAQTAPVINALWRRMPTLRVTLRTGLPRALLATRLDRSFEYLPVASDFGMVMQSAFAVRVEESAARYREFHRNWPARVAAEADQLASLAPDAVFANVPYLTLAGAALAGIPAAAMCSLNWADIYRGYFFHRPEAPAIHAQMLASYNSAAVFLQPEPSMPMDDVLVRRAIGPVARLGRNRRAEIDQRLHLNGEERLVVVAPGGIETHLPVQQWPQLPHLRWIVPTSWQVDRPDVLSHDALGMGFTDLMCSCDVLVTKPGYGSFTEAACNGVPVIYAPRPDWPEAPCLVDWLRANARAAEITWDQLVRGDCVEVVDDLLASPPPKPVRPSGVDEAADILAAFLAA